MLLSGLLLTGCASTDTDFSSVPGPSGGGTAAATTPVATPAAPAKSAPAATPVASASSNPSQPATSKPPKTPSIVTPDTSWAAKVVSYNSVGRFVVLNFPLGQNPKMDQTVFVYRNGLKVGELKITGPQRDNNVVADLVSGEARSGDEARDR